MAAYSCTSLNVAEAVNTSSIVRLVSARPARPPRTAESSTLASATSFTLVLSPGPEIGNNFFFLDAAPLQLARQFRAENGKQLPLQFNWQAGFWTRKENPSQTPVAGHQYRVFGSQKAAGAIAKFAHCPDF